MVITGGIDMNEKTISQCLIFNLGTNMNFKNNFFFRILEMDTLLGED